MASARIPPRRKRADPATEIDLLARAPSEPEAFAQLYDLYVERVYRYAFGHLSTHADAEDLTAETFSRALDQIGRYEWRGVPFGAWLFRIAHNLLVDRYRVKPLARWCEADGSGKPRDGRDSWSDPEASALAFESKQSVWDAVATLPPLQRRAVTLRFGRGLSHAEIGSIIGRSEPATKQIVYRAVRSLRSRLQEE